MADHYLALPGGLTACFKTACAIGTQERLQLGAYVPGISFLDKVPDCVDITLEHEFSDTPGLVDNGSYIKLCAPKSEKLPADLYHLFCGIERRTLLEKGFYSVHAACVGKDDDYILIVGHSGAGKTTLAQNLVDKHDMKLFSGNKTVVRFECDGSLKAVAGTKTMTALDDGLNRYAYEMMPDNYAQQPEVKIKSVVLVRVNDGVEETQTLEPSSALHTLYPYFMDAVNADVIVNGKDVLDGAPSANTRRKLAENLRLIANHIPVFKHSGTMLFLEKKVLQP